MSNDTKPCPDGVPWCASHDPLEDGSHIHRLDVPCTAAAWKVGIGELHFGHRWDYKISVTGAQWCDPDGSAADGLVSIHQDGGTLFHMEADEAYTLGVSILEAVFQVANYHHGAIHEYVVGDLEQRLGGDRDAAVKAAA